MPKRLTLTEELERLLVTHELAVRLDVELSHISQPAKKEKMRERANAAWVRFHERQSEFLTKLEGARSEQNA